MAKLVRDLMHPGLFTCRPEATLGQVAVILDQNHVHALFVTDRSGRPTGVITDFDLLAGEWLSANHESLETMRKMTAGELMSTPINNIEADQPCHEAAQQMIKLQVRRLLVVDKGKPVGVISVSDIIANFAKETPLERGTVADVMSDAILVCRGKTPVAAAARAMTSTGWRSVLVVDPKGKPLGVVSGIDILPLCDHEDYKDKTVSDVMHPALTIHMNESLQAAANMMIENHHHRLLVVDQDEPDSMPLGIISSFDIVAEMARPGSVWQK